jgi:hypothetical protein
MVGVSPVTREEQIVVKNEADYVINLKGNRQEIGIEAMFWRFRRIQI